MRKKKSAAHDPRLETPPGYFLRSAQLPPEQEKPTVFFSVRDSLVFAFLVLACLVVGTMLWIKPPKYISFDADKPFDPAVAAKNMPKQLQKFPSYDTRQFEEITEDDPSITSDEEELPMKDPAEHPLPKTIKSEIKKWVDYLLASLGIKIIA